MSWAALPLDLFALVVAIIEPNDAVKLETVCKTWNENLKNDLIWQGLCQMHGRRDNTYQSWKICALITHVVKNNIKENRFLSRAFAIARTGTRRYGTVQGYCSAAGNEVLITWAEYENYSSYWFTHFMYHEIINLDTWVRTPVNITNPKALLTTKYIISTDYAPGSYFCKQTVSITDRSSNVSRSVTIKEIGANDTVSWLKNTDLNVQKLAFVGKQNFFVLDLDSGQYSNFNCKSQLPYRMEDCQFAGKYFLYKYDLEIHVVDTKNKTEAKVISLTKDDASAAFYLDGSQLVLILAKGWQIIDLDKQTTKKFESFMLSDRWYMVSPIIYNDYVIVRHGSFLKLFNKKTGSLISTLALYGMPLNSSANALLSCYGAGKLIIGDERSARVIDFESASINSEVTMVLMNSNGSSSPKQVKFGKLLEYAAVSCSVPIGQIVSVVLDQADNYRISMVYSGASFEITPLIGGDKNEEATLLWKKHVKSLSTSINLVATSIAHSVNMKVYRFNTSWSQVVNGPAIFYKEEFKLGAWVPVDFNCEGVNLLK